MKMKNQVWVHRGVKEMKEVGAEAVGSLDCGRETLTQKGL